MRSSGSTRSPPPSGLPLFLERVGDDHPKACTGRRLLDRGWAAPRPRGPTRLGRPLLLDPHAPTPLAPSDAELGRAHGLLAIDCSWNALGARGTFPEGFGGRGRPRRLPWLLAANPQHFGRLGELNTAEALAAGLYVLGEPARALALIAEFPGGRGWAPLNARFLEAYAACSGPEEILEAERRLFG